MKLKDWLVPREEKFFDLLEEQSALVLEGADALVKMLESYDSMATAKGGGFHDAGVREHKRIVKEIEHRADLKTHDIFQALNATFITPLDREDIAALASAQDDILDYIYDVAKHLYLYEVTTAPKGMFEVSLMLRDQTRNLREAMGMLPDPAQREGLNAKLVEINSLENKADDLTDRMKQELFHSQDIKYVLKMKDILDYLETATDKCEDAADVIRDILVKHQ